MTNEIVKAGQTNIIRTIDDAERAARAMSASGFFADTKQASQAIVKILAGQELGFGPFASMTGVNIIQNKPVLAANLMAAAVKRTGKYNYRVTKQTDEVCELTWFESGQEVGKSSFTIVEAQRAGLAGKDNWKRYPSDMLFARAISRGQKRFAPDIFNGATVYTPDEMGAVVDEDGNMIATASEPVEVTTTKPAQVQSETNQTEETATDIILLDPHGPEAVAIADGIWNIGARACAVELWKIFPKGTKNMTAQEIKAAILQGTS